MGINLKNARIEYGRFFGQFPASVCTSRKERFKRASTKFASHVVKQKLFSLVTFTAASLRFLAQMGQFPKTVNEQIFEKVNTGYGVREMPGLHQTRNAHYAETSRGFIQYVQTYFFQDGIVIISCHIITNISFIKHHNYGYAIHLWRF
jgi:hypothetical protein